MSETAKGPDFLTTPCVSRCAEFEISKGGWVRSGLDYLGDIGACKAEIKGGKILFEHTTLIYEPTFFSDFTSK